MALPTLYSVQYTVAWDGMVHYAPKVLRYSGEVERRRRREGRERARGNVECNFQVNLIAGGRARAVWCLIVQLLYRILQWYIQTVFVFF